MLRTLLVLVTLATLRAGPEANAAPLYDNTTTSSGNILAFSGDTFEIGDQIRLSSAGTADQATVQFTSTGAGVFEADLLFLQVGSPVGSQILPGFVGSNVVAPEGARISP